MRYLWIALITVLGVFADCEVRAAQQSIPDAVLEETLLKEVEGATREGETLTLQTGGETVTFVDRVDAGEGSAKYYLVDRLRPARDYYYLVRVVGYEGKGYALVCQKTGQTINLNGKPTFSPDGKRFVEVSLDLDAGYNPNLIGIYALEDNNYTMEWKHIYQGAKGPANPVWLDNSAIVFFEVTFDNVPTVSNLKKRPYIIEWDNNQWNMPRPLK